MNLIGKRYECEQCGAQVLCTSAGDGELTCCGTPMPVTVAKAMPASD